MKYYSIQTVAQFTGLSSHCIRAWEKRYKAVTPSRSENGRRLYSEEELNRLMMLGKLSSLGNSISLIANLPDEELIRLLEKMTNGRGMDSRPIKNLVDPKVYLNNLFLALSSYKLDVITHELNKASVDLTCRDFALEVVGALFKKVGEYVHDGRMNIAQEHALSAITKFFIGRRIYEHYRSDKKGKFKITLATPSGEQHSIGLMLSCLLMVDHHVDFIYLGENLPEESIATAAKATESDVVLLSVSPAYSDNTRNINDVAHNLKKHLPEKTQLWIGGAVHHLHKSTINELGITTFSDLMGLEEKLSRQVSGE